MIRITGLFPRGMTKMLFKSFLIIDGYIQVA